MAQITIELDNHIAKKLDNLIRYFGSKDLLFNNFIEYHKRNIQREISQMQVDLNVYEDKYQLSSDSFYDKFERGEVEDSKDFILWAGLYEMQLDSKKKLA
jgi:hypothetical protein